MSEKVVSFIPIKLNNERVPGKNLTDLGGRPLCFYMFNTMRHIDAIHEKYVYCSDDKIKSYIPEGLIYLKRDASLDGYQVRGLEIIEHFVRDVDADVYVLAHVTQPFTRAESIKKALDMVLTGRYDSAFSCVARQGYFWYQDKPLNYSLQNIPRTQDVEAVYQETSAFFIFRREVFTKLHQRIGRTPYMCPVGPLEAIDIDTPADLDLARAVAKYYREKDFI